MAKALLIVPLDDNNAPDLQMLEDETLATNTGEMQDVKLNEFVYQADETLPAGYDEILSSEAQYDNEVPPNITGYRLHCLRSATVNAVYGGHIMLAPARGGLPVALVMVASSQAKLDVLNTRLRALSPTNFYGRVPLVANTATRDAIAGKLDELAALPGLSGRTGVISALENAADDVRAINNLQTWKRDFWAVLGTLFQIDSGRIDKMGIAGP